MTLAVLDMIMLVSVGVHLYCHFLFSHSVESLKGHVSLSFFSPNTGLDRVQFKLRTFKYFTLFYYIFTPFPLYENNATC